MAKKGKDEVPNPTNVPNRDILQRMNFLYQASVYLNSLARPLPDAVPSNAHTPPTQSNRKDKQRTRRSQRHPTTYADLSRCYVRNMKTIGQKTNVKMDPAVKRTLCKKCHIVLVSGVSASVRVKPSSAHGHVMVYKCTTCNTVRRIPAPPTLRAPRDTADTIPQPHMSEATCSVESDAMNVDTAGPSKGGQEKKLRTQAHPLPLFAQDVGHVLYRGNEQVDTSNISRFMC